MKGKARDSTSPIFLDEFRETKGVALTEVQVQELRRIVKENEKHQARGAGFGDFRIVSSGEVGRYDVFPGSWVGVIGLPDLEIVIRPKIPIERVVYLMCRGLGMGRPLQREVTLRKAETLLEVMARVFASRLSPIVRRGLLHGYRTEEESLHVVRGRIRLHEQLARRFGRLPPAEVRYDDYTDDIEENRLLKAALERLRRLPMRDDEVRQQLSIFKAALAFVHWRSYHPRRMPEITYTRLNRHYRPAVEIAKLILRGMSMEPPQEGIPGEARGFGFLFDMNEVFEAFVYEALREALGLTEGQFPRGGKGGRTLHLDEERRLRLLPDLTWWEMGQCRFVGDVKYKMLDDGGYQQSDYYQLLAYLMATDVRNGLLVYAGGEAASVAHHVVNSKKVIQVEALNLGGEIGNIEAQVQALAERVRDIRNGSARRHAA